MQKIIFLLIISCICLSIPCFAKINSLSGEPGIFPAKYDTMVNDCTKGQDVARVIHSAIAIGAPTYNTGNHLGCYRIYEGAAYKILYEYNGACPAIEKVLKAALEKAHSDVSDIERAWIMRVAFDTILGEPTVTGNGEPKPVPSEKG